MSRYYSQAYERLDDDTWNPRASEEASRSNINLGSYEPYGAGGHPHEDDAPLNRDGTAYQQAMPSTMLNSRYPQRGFKGLKSKHWDQWSGRKKMVVVGSVIAVFIIIIAVVVSVTVVEETKDNFSFTLSDAKVTNPSAFTSGGARYQVPQSVHDGVGAGENTYTYYEGDAANFPDRSRWVSLQPFWSANLPTIEGGCKTLGDGDNDTPEQIQYIYDAIVNRSSASLVDHRLILAVILQESQGCVHVGQTKSNTGVSNPGLMQSHDGHSFDESKQEESILAMVQDGTQGTSSGPGLVQLLNEYGNPYKALRVYNSGLIASNGNLSDGAGATACYVSDIANRLTGWTTAPNKCPGEMGST